MTRSAYPVWFLGAVSFVLAAIVAFNVWSDAYILHHPAGASLQTVSGFERVIKPAWLQSIGPDVVFVGSSRIRDGFDPVLIDPAFGVRSFNYGVSSISAYEARRFVQDAAAQASVKTIVLSLDAFSGDDGGRRAGQGFDELRLAVTADGAPTSDRNFWLFTTRYLSGGALGMHALGLYLLEQLAPGQRAAERPDLFEAYSGMTPAVFRHDMLYRRARVMRMADGAHAELLAALDSVCRRNIRLLLFFPPDNAAIQARYEANDPAGLAAFKASVVADARRHNQACEGKVSVFDFMNRNAITTTPLVDGKSEVYVDLVHFHPAIGVRLFRVMFDPAHAEADGALAHDLAAANR
jgi:hypothetical protein